MLTLKRQLVDVLPGGRDCEKRSVVVHFALPYAVMEQMAGDEGLDKPQGLRFYFPGYFPPGSEDVKRFIENGLVVFDTNALFDLYRFNDQARDEYFASMRLLKDRLWIPHRVANELLERRLDVIRECSTAVQKLMSDLEGSFDSIRQQIRAFGNRRGLPSEKIADLESLVGDSVEKLADSAKEAFPFQLKIDSSLRSDPILREIEGLLDGRIGPPLQQEEDERKEGLRRIAAKIPPGYADLKKEPERAVGDYFIWRQLISEVKRRGAPVLLVTNDKKVDWIREYQGRTIGPRPELVAEIQQETGQDFHLIRVQSFLLYAQKYLGAVVSRATVRQAEQFNVNYEILGKFMDLWAQFENALVDYIYHTTGERPKNIVGILGKYEKLVGLSAVEQAQLHNLRNFRNTLVHSGNFSSTDSGALEDSLDLLEEFLDRVRNASD